MQTIILTMLAAFFSAACSSGEEPGNNGKPTDPEDVREVSFTSSDKNLSRTFYWGKQTALGYAHDDSDPVGYWYEAALPGRHAFCMRDMAHQSIGGEILGLSKHNFNMTYRFAENIRDGLDWCSYWEIDKWNKPCPADYVDDANFWYNLNANFDVIFACWRLYEWTGDERYLHDPVLKNFFELSMDDYVERWQLEPDEMMSRPRYMNIRETTTNNYKGVRGLASYVENYPGIVTSSDLIATMYGGFEAYSKILEESGVNAASAEFKLKAQKYYDLLKDKWWNSSIDAYHTFWTDKNVFADGEGLTYMLWFDATQEPDRIRGTVSKIMSRKNWNIENTSHFPLLWYRYNHNDEAYDILSNIINMHRSDYPEVSYGMVEGIVSGAMGIVPSASQKKVVTLPKLPTQSDYAEVKDVPMLKGYVTVRHDGNTSTTFTNDTPGEVTWEAAFMGEHARISVDGEVRTTSSRTDRLGNKISYVEIKVPAEGVAKAGVH